MLTSPLHLTAFSGFPSFSFSILSSFSSYVGLAVLGYLHARLSWFLFCIKLNSASAQFLFECTSLIGSFTHWFRLVTCQGVAPESLKRGDLGLKAAACVGYPCLLEASRWLGPVSNLCLGFDVGEQRTVLASHCVAVGLGPQQECCVTDTLVCQLVGGSSVF